MNKRYLSLASIMTLCFLLLLISGCGSSGNKEGELSRCVDVGEQPASSAIARMTEALTGQALMAQYENSSPHKDSAHANNGNGCEACHGNASQHQGKGPISYANPYADSGARCADCHKGNYAGNFNTQFASSNHANVRSKRAPRCVRCHTHEGALLSNIAGFTGDYTVLENKAYQTVAIPAKGWSNSSARPATSTAAVCGPSRPGTTTSSKPMRPTGRLLPGIRTTTGSMTSMTSAPAAIP